MNFVILNDKEFFNDIELNNFKEVSIDDRNRVDGLFGSITGEILGKSTEELRNRNPILREEWFYRNSGIVFMVFRITQDILYDGTGESLERCLGFFNKEDVYAEMGAIKLENKENTYEYILIVYQKSLGFKLLFDEKFIEKKEDEIIPYICEKLNKIL